MFLSRFAETGFLNAMRGTNFAAPAQVFCGLFTSSPGDSGTDGVEISYSGYTRMPIQFTPPTVEGTGIGVRNTAQITYPQSNINAGTVRFIGIFDSATAGNMYLYGALTEDLPVLQGESPVLLLNEVLFFGIGDMSVAYKTRLFNVIRGQTLSGFNCFCALFNGDPQNGGAELAGGNFERTPITFSAPEVIAGGIQVIKNSAQIIFPRPTVNLGTWTHTAIYNAQNSGEPVWIQQRTTPKVINRGIMPLVDAGALIAGIN